MKIGDIEILPVLDGSALIPATAAYAGKTEEDLAPHRGLLDPDGRLEMAFGGFLVRAGDRVGLIDAGLGPRAPRPLCPVASCSTVSLSTGFPLATSPT